MSNGFTESKKISSMICRFVAFFIFLSLLFASSSSFGRPYRGDVFTFLQPDGQEFQVRLYGDEYYAVVETLDGYTLTKDLQTRFYTYAKAAPDRMSFISTGIRPGDPLPHTLKLKKNIRLAPQALKRLSEAARTKFGVDSKGQLLPWLRLRLRPQDYGYERWAPALEADAQALESASGSITLAPPASTTIGTRVGLVLLAEFPDRPGDVTISQSEIDAYANDPTYTGFGNATSVYGYFSIQSGDKLQYNCIVTAYFTAAQPRDYYTDPDLFPSDPNNNGFGIRAKELINEGLASLKADGFDFTSVDGNGDGILDGVNIFYAGSRVNNWGEGLWPHKWSSTWDVLSGEGLASSGFEYQITEIGSSLSLGTFSHETGHMICGFPDLYPYNGNGSNLSNYSIMHYPGTTHPVNVDAYLKIHAGWATVIDIDSDSHLRGAVQVDTNTFYRFRNPAESREYFLLSLRTDSGYEGIFGGSTVAVNPTSGLVVYHALEQGSNTHSSIFTADSGNPIADYSTPYELMVVEAVPASSTVPWYDSPAPGIDDSFRSGGVNEVSDSTMPALKFWNTVSGRTTDSNLYIHSVSSQGDTMSFVVGSGAVTGSSYIALTSFSFTPSCDFGTDVSPQSFSIFNSGSGTVNYIITADVPWISVSPSLGTVTTEADLITVNYTTNDMAPGIYNGTLTVTDTSSSNSPRTISVTLTVYARPVIALSTVPMNKSLAAGAGGTDSFTISNTGGGTLFYTLLESSSWLALSTLSGTVAAEDDEITVTFDATGLFEGVYTSKIFVNSTNSTNAPQAVNVTLTVSGHISVFDPDGGEQIMLGNQHDIRWMTDGTVTGNVKIELYKSGVVDAVIASDIPNDGLFTWTVTGSSSPIPEYRVRITSVNEPVVTGESFSSFSIFPSIAYPGIPSIVSFESCDFGAWSQSTGDDIDWTCQAEATPSNSTGPAAAADGVYYIFTEASNPNYPGKVAVLEGSFDLRSAAAPILAFSYHMYGAGMGSLLIQASPDQDNWTTLFSMSGDMGEKWYAVNVDLSSLAGKAIVIRITGTTGSSWMSDMALDGIVVSDLSDFGPEMDVRGNTVSIADGDISPSLADHTDFEAVRVNGGTVDRTFTIVNTGTATLSLNGIPKVEIGGLDPGDFTVTADPAGSVSSGGGATSFTVQFDPGGKGMRSAVVTVANDDTDENPYTFGIQGTGIPFPWLLFKPAIASSVP